MITPNEWTANQIRNWDDLEQELYHFRTAYSRALNFVAEQHYTAIPSTPSDDPFFKSVDGNACATDILIAKVKELEYQLSNTKFGWTQCQELLEKSQAEVMNLREQLKSKP